MTISPLVELAGRALSSVARHALLYLALVAGTIALHAVLLTRWNSPAASPFADFTVEPLLDTIIVAVALADLRGDGSARSIWSRALERAWAMILVNLAITFVALYGVGSLAGGLADKLLAILLLLISAALVYAPVGVVIDDDSPWWMLVGRAFGGSVRVALAGPNFARALLLFALQFVPVLLASALEPILAARHLARAEFWASVPVATILEPLLMTFIAFVYFDALGMARGDACSE